MLLCYQTISLIKSMCFSDFTNQNMKTCTFMCIDVCQVTKSKATHI